MSKEQYINLLNRIYNIVKNPTIIVRIKNIFENKYNEIKKVDLLHNVIMFDDKSNITFDNYENIKYVTLMYINNSNSTVFRVSHVNGELTINLISYVNGKKKSEKLVCFINDKLYRYSDSICDINGNEIDWNQIIIDENGVTIFGKKFDIKNYKLDIDKYSKDVCSLLLEEKSVTYAYTNVRKTKKQHK